MELSEDRTYQDCAALEAASDREEVEKYHNKGKKEYCTFHRVLKQGEQGLPFNFNFCQFPNEDEVRVIHHNGLISFCQNNSKAYKLGFEGKYYNQICPKNLEANFLKHFDKGRRQKLINEIGFLKSKIKQNDREVFSLRIDQSEVTRDLLSLPAVLPDRHNQPGLRRFLPNKNQSIEEQRNQLTQKLHKIQDQILKLKKEKIQHSEKIKIYQQELKKI